jgi:Putative metal-binding motif
MRTVIGLTLVAMSALSLHAAGCASSETDPTSTTGTTSSSGTGGEGGVACVPEEEICDTLDNDCDSEVDEGCECVAGETQDCYGGPRGTAGIGVCAMGTQDCNLAMNTFGPCKNDVTPASSDACDGLDNDCNGEVDDNIPDMVCGVGACMAVAPGCVDGEPGECVPGLPSLEVCDGLDNDCDQLTDEVFAGAGDACDTGIPGVCAPGTMQCDGVGPTCMPLVLPGGELCDDLDNDCNGVVDDNLPGTGGECSTGFPGVCAAGSISCQGGEIDCFPLVAPSSELCDDIDNDCNGLVDDGNPEGGGGCDTGLFGVCQSGTLFCNDGALDCEANAAPSAEVCDGLDNNCDGQPDEGDPGGGVACGCGGLSACSNGASVCVGGPAVYFSETFANNSAGWTLDTDWGIGSAMASSGQSFGFFGDPAADHTPTADNGVAGVVIGGNAPIVVHPFYYLTSPPFSANGPGSVYFQYWRWLNSDYTPYMQNVIDVYNGSSWVQVFTTAGSSTIDGSWIKFSYDLTAHKNAGMRIRFGFLIGQTLGTYTVGSWNVDDVLVTDGPCP